MNYPLFIISYNRPGYLTTLLASISEWLVQAASNREIYLFQDGAYSHFFKRNKTDQNLIDECCEIFHSYFPDGEIHRSKDNLGIGLNVNRAEKFAFEELKANAAIFFEDDLLVGPEYLKTVDMLLDLALDDNRIGVVSAYGFDLKTSLEEQSRRQNEIGSMHHNWGYGITSRHWFERNQIVEPYIRSLEGVDYLARSYLPAFDIFEKFGFPALPSNQDFVKNFATYVLGKVRITTAVINALYIGALGEHFSGSLYASQGYIDSSLNDGRISQKKIEELTDESYHQLINYSKNEILNNELSLSDQYRYSLQCFARVISFPSFEDKVIQDNGLKLKNIGGIFPADFFIGQVISFEINTELSIDLIKIRGHSPVYYGQDPLLLDVFINEEFWKSFSTENINFEILLPGSLFSIAKDYRVKILSKKVFSPKLFFGSEDSRILSWVLCGLEFIRDGIQILNPSLEKLVYEDDILARVK